MEQMNFEVQIIDFDSNTLIKYKESRLPLVLYRFDRPKSDDYTVFSGIDDFRHSYIYFLIGTDYRDSLVSIYVGQSGIRNKSTPVFQRIKEHSSESWGTYWNMAYILTREDKNIDETCLNYLENYFYTLIKNEKQYKVWNAITPTEGHPSEAQKIDLNKDIKTWEDMFHISGISFTERKPLTKSQNVLSGLYSDFLDIEGKKYPISFYSFKTRSGGDARICKIDKFYTTKGTRGANDYYLILKGSRLSGNYALNAINDKNCKRAREYISKYCLDNEGCLKEDIPVTSATSASTIIKGSHSSTMKGWQKITGALTEEQCRYLASPPLFYIQYNEINAVLKKKGLGYIILKGSAISRTIETDRKDKKVVEIIVKERKRLEAEGIIREYVFTKDYYFESKNMAEGIIQGKKMSANWRRYCDFGYIDIAREPSHINKILD